MVRQTDQRDAPNEFAIAFGARLREARLAKNPVITGEALGNQVGAKKANVSQWETGKHMPDLETLSAICDVLDCSADRLLGREEHGLSAAAVAEAKAFDVLSQEDRRKWRALRLTLFGATV